MCRCFGAADPVGTIIAILETSQADCNAGKRDSSNARGGQDLWRAEENRMASSKNNRVRVMVSLMHINPSTGWTRI